MPDRVRATCRIMTVWLVMLGGTERWWLAHGMIEDAFGAILAN